MTIAGIRPLSSNLGVKLVVSSTVALASAGSELFGACDIAVWPVFGAWLWTANGAEAN